MHLIALAVLLVSILATIVTSGYVTNNIVHTTVEGLGGTWKKKWSWKARWVKTWKAKTVYVAHWTKVWSPAETREYIPLPPIPPNWEKPSHHHHHY